MPNWLTAVVVLSALVLVSAIALLPQAEKDDTASAPYYHDSESAQPAEQAQHTVRYYDSKYGWVNYEPSDTERVYNFDNKENEECDETGFCLYRVHNPESDLPCYENTIEIYKDDASHVHSGVIHPRRYTEIDNEEWVYIDFAPPAWTTVIHLSDCQSESKPLFEIKAPLDESSEDTVVVGRDEASSPLFRNSGVVLNRGHSSNGEPNEFRKYRYFPNGTFVRDDDE